jgi:lipopolysaccharide transport system ATP-binding protein
MGEIALRVEHLTKEYRLGTIGYGTLREDLQSWWAGVRGKEDPNSLVTLKHSAQSDEKHFLALDDVSFEVKKGERLGIIGKNGAGKSTLLKILSRITTPTDGLVKLRGRVGSLLEVGTGFHPELTGRENVYLNGSIHGMNKSEIEAKLDEIVEFAGISRFVDTPVKRYSSGMFVRLGFAVAAHLEPDILIVDEVLAVGDAEFQKKAIGKMQDVSRDEGRTILFVSHNMASIRRLCGSSLWLSNGTARMIGGTDDVVHSYLDSALEAVTEAELRLPLEPKKSFQLTSARTKTAAGETRVTFESDEEILIELTALSREPLPGLYGYLQVANADQQSVIVSDSDELGSQALNNLTPGEHVFELRVPKRLLGTGWYTVSLNFTSSYHEGGFQVDSPGRILSFEIIDRTSKRGNNRNSLLSTLIEWEHKDNSRYPT